MSSVKTSGRAHRPGVHVVTSAVAAALLPLLVLGMASCSSPQDAGKAITVDNCGGTVTFDTAPQRVTLLKSASVTTLAHLGVLDRVTHRAGKYPSAYYSDEINRTLASIPSLTDKTDTSGHLQISREEVVADSPDLVIGQTDTVNRQTLSSSNIPLIEEPAFCGTLGEDKGSQGKESAVSWDDVWDQIRLYGTVFDRGSEAENYVNELQSRLDAVRATESAPASAPASSPSIAVLYPTIGGGVTYAYGTGSMANPVVEAAGARNIYHDQAQRVFEVSAEDIVNRNPDVILALYSDGDEQQIIDAVTQLPGMDRTTAGRRGHILPMLLNFAEPPTPLAVDGLEKLDTYLAGLKK